MTLGPAVENSCSYLHQRADGHLGHDRDCWVHTDRDALQRVATFIDQARVWRDHKRNR